MAPVIRLGRAMLDGGVTVVSTGQHRDMLAAVFDLFEFAPDICLDVMGGGDLNGLTMRVLRQMDQLVRDRRPRRIVVHGDTTSAMGAAMAAFHLGVPVAHVEAGLRTGDLARPFPEEFNRRMVDMVADLHFAPTEGAAQHLRREGVRAGGIQVTGNTAIDALLHVTERLAREPALADRLDPVVARLDPGGRRLILVTLHRRENYGPGLEAACRAIAALAGRGDVEIVLPVHMNPAVRSVVRAVLGGIPGIHLTEPLDYLTFVALMRRAYLIMTDSGGIQEEAPSLDVPVLVMRDKTERPEGVAAGALRLVGTDTAALVAAAETLLEDAGAHARMAAAENPYGDGHAARRIVERLASGACTS